MRKTSEPAQRASIASTRLILLPGAYQCGADFLREGFVAAARERGFDVDFDLLDIGFDEIEDGRLARRLREEVIAPARAQGCPCIWLVGISLGGFVCLDYMEQFAGDIDGICLLSPYLGNRMLLGEILAAGGLDAWTPGVLASGDTERRIWRHIKTRPTPSPLVYLGYGREDRFAQAQTIMSAALASHCVDVVAGGHDWNTWLRLWKNFLGSGLI